MTITQLKKLKLPMQLKPPVYHFQSHLHHLEFDIYHSFLRWSF